MVINSKFYKGIDSKKGIIFKEYVDRLYQLRLKFKSGTPMNLIAKLLMNSLYGKFGMKPEKTTVNIFDQRDSSEVESMQSFTNTHNESIQDIVEVGNFSIIVRGGIDLYDYNKNQDLWHGLDVNIAIASAITSGARMVMSKVKNSTDFDLYYTDTDSAVINRPLPAEMVGSALGKFKLEHEISEAVFLAPKVYGFITSDGSEVIKIKGIAKEQVSKITLADLKKLLVKETSMYITQEKWYKSIFEGDIEVVKVAHELKATSNKRQPQYLTRELYDGSIISVFTHSEALQYSEIK
jgi:hypothetical protein